MITSAIQQIVNTDRTELKDFLNEVDKLHKTAEAVTAKIANNVSVEGFGAGFGFGLGIGFRLGIGRTQRLLK
jgi:uncharacterized phosphosugar-binding protein